jgi:hypothetical protein
MATAAKFVQPILIFLAYLVPKMAAVAMETTKMLKKLKNTKMIIAGYSPNRN